MVSPPLLEVTDLVVRYRPRRGAAVDAVRSVGFTVAAGETVALVGESGSGKSTIAHTVLGLLPPAATVTGGQVRFDGQDVTRLGERRWRGLRGRELALVPQDPSTALNPVLRVGPQVAEPLVLHGLADRRGAAARAVELLAEAGVPDPGVRARQHPHELSGGLRQRVLIATALAAQPRLIVADEPTSNLDVTVQRRILDRLGELTRERGTSVLLITHDLGIAAERADRVLVLSEGRIVEEGTGEVLTAPRHPYTIRLRDAAPGLRPAASRLPVPGDGDGDGAGDRARAGDGAEPGEHVRVEGLVKEFRLPDRRLLRAVDDVGFTVRRGETFALVGESGSGKSTTARLVLRLTDPDGGRIVVDGEDVTRHTGRALRALRRKAQLIHQNPHSSLNPRFTVAQVIADPLASFGVGTRKERRQRAAELLDRVALPPTVLDRKPAELSGGQRQRVAIARALALAPALVVCDEPVSALDVSVQAQILDLLAELQADLGVTYLFISHDLAVVRQVAHRVGVMRHGRLVEQGETEQIFTAPEHPYTEELLAAIPGRRPADAPA